VFFRERMAEAIAEPFVVFFLGAAIVAIVKRIGKLSGKEGAEEETLIAIEEEGQGTESREEEPVSSPVTSTPMT
jgi:hypothetical protein